MSDGGYDPFKDESLGKSRRRRPPVMIDWKAVARRLAEGESPGQVAAALGLKEDRIWDHLKRSLRFRFLLQQALERQRLLTDLRIAAGGRSALIGRGLQAEGMDGEMLRCLLAEDSLAAPKESAGDLRSDLGGRIERLGATARPAPNMALRRRLAAEKREMDAAVAESVAFLAASDAVRAAAGHAERTEMKAKEAETKANEPDRSQTKANEAEGRETKPAETPPPVGSAAARPAAPPPRPQLRTIVDLDGPDLARLKESGALPP